MSGICVFNVVICRVRRLYLINIKTLEENTVRDEANLIATSELSNMQFINCIFQLSGVGPKYRRAIQKKGRKSKTKDAHCTRACVRVSCACRSSIQGLGSAVRVYLFAASSAEYSLSDIILAAESSSFFILPDHIKKPKDILWRVFLFSSLSQIRSGLRALFFQEAYLACTQAKNQAQGRWHQLFIVYQ